MEEIEKDFSRELDTLENAISDDNHALAVCSREEIWKIVYRIVNIAVSKERERIVDIVKSTQDKYHSKDKNTEEGQYSGGGICRQCGKRRDSLEIEDIINLINTK